MDTVASRLRKERDKSGYTQTEIATILGFDRSTFASWETGRREPDYDTIKKLAHFYGVTTDYLLGKSDESGNKYRKKNSYVLQPLPKKPEKTEIARQVQSLADYLKKDNFTVAQVLTEYDIIDSVKEIVIPKIKERYSKIYKDSHPFIQKLDKFNDEPIEKQIDFLSRAIESIETTNKGLEVTLKTATTEEINIISLFYSLSADDQVFVKRIIENLVK